MNESKLNSSKHFPNLVVLIWIWK